MLSTGYTRTIDYYNAIATSYSTSTAAKVINSKADEFVAMLPQGGKIADIGCGPGHDSRYFASLGYDVIGSDASENMIQIATEMSENIINIKYRVCNVFDFNETNLYDGIWCSSLLVHIDKADVTSTIEKIRNGLVDNGTLGIITAKQQDKTREADDYRLYTMFSQDELNGLITNTGFDIIKSSIFSYGGRDRIFIIGKK